MNLPVQDLIRQKWVSGRCKNLEFLSQSVPKAQENKRLKKRISVYWQVERNFQYRVWWIFFLEKNKQACFY